jgi:DNA-binding CsgD family transcriptional regulator
VPKSYPPKKPRSGTSRAIVLATSRGKIQFAEASARRWLKEFFGRPARAGVLPRKVCSWLGHRDSPSGRSLLAQQADVRLYVRRANAYPPDTTVLLVELIKGKGEELSRRHRDLTPREREVLLWLTRGKSNSEIAKILEIKPATVSKHLERIYPKLGVENRAAAINLNLQDRQLLN